MRNEVLCIIPARGGSKRIPGKNIKNFLGKPIIEYSIKTALASGLFDEVMVSTDDQKIAEIAEKSGAKIPFMRSKNAANDFAGIADVISEVLDEYKNQGKDFKFFCCFFPTAPLVSKEKLVKAFQILKTSSFDSIFPVAAFSYPIQRALKINTENKVSMIWPENYPKRSQDLEPCYHDAGQFYFMKTDIFLKEKTVFCENASSIISSDLEVQDIDNISDWKLAELKYQLLEEDNETRS